MLWGEEGPCDTFIHGGSGISQWCLGCGRVGCLGGTPASGVVQGAAPWWGPAAYDLEAEIPQHFKMRTGHLNYKWTEGPKIPQSQGYG